MYVYNTFSKKYNISSPLSKQDILIGIKMVEGIFCLPLTPKGEKEKMNNEKYINLLSTKKAEPEIMIVGKTLSGFRQLSLII